jgi:hypothetical protein
MEKRKKMRLESSLVKSSLLLAYLNMKIGIFSSGIFEMNTTGERSAAGLVFKLCMLSCVNYCQHAVASEKRRENCSAPIRVRRERAAAAYNS